MRSNLSTNYELLICFFPFSNRAFMGQKYNKVNDEKDILVIGPAMS